MEIIDGNGAQADDEAVEEEEEADETHPAQGPQIGVAGGEREEREREENVKERGRGYVGGGEEKGKKKEKEKKNRGEREQREREEKKLRKEGILGVVKKINILKNEIVMLK